MVATLGLLGEAALEQRGGCGPEMRGERGRGEKMRGLGGRLSEIVGGGETNVERVHAGRQGPRAREWVLLRTL